jgi:hypothetical protein
LHSLLKGNSFVRDRTFAILVINRPLILLTSQRADQTGGGDADDYRSPRPPGSDASSAAAFAACS